MGKKLTWLDNHGTDLMAIATMVVLIAAARLCWQVRNDPGMLGVGVVLTGFVAVNAIRIFRHDALGVFRSMYSYLKKGSAHE